MGIKKRKSIYSSGSPLITPIMDMGIITPLKLEQEGLKHKEK